MPDLSEAFFESCTKHFNFFTEELGFRQENIKSGSHNRVRLHSEKLVIECALEWLELYLYVSLFPQTEFPFRTSFTRLPVADFKRYGYSLDMLLLLRAPDTDCQVTTGRRLTADDMDKIIACFADCLKKYGQDILHGDLTAFPEMEILAKENYKRRMKEEEGEKKGWSFWDLFRR